MSGTHYGMLEEAFDYKQKGTGAFVKKKYLGVCLILVLIATLLGGCDKKEESDNLLVDGTYLVYYINNNATGIVEEKYKVKSKTTDEKIEELIQQMSVDPESYAYKRSITEDMIIKEYTLTDQILTINFDSSYLNLKPMNEVLSRAAVVKTLTQIPDVKYVEFYVNGSQLTDTYDKPISQMAAEDFISDNDLENGDIPAIISLYFATEDGHNMIECEEKKMYDGSITMEQLILWRLIAGPDEIEQENGLKPVIPPNTILNNVTTKEGVCYVDFSKEFLTPVDGVDEEVSIYAVVNALVELSNINKVQFMIDGQIKETYLDKVELDIIFERKLGLIEGTK